MTDTAAVPLSDSLAARWAALLPALQKEFGDAAFRSWIAPIAPLRCAQGVLELSVATRFMRDWVRGRYADGIRRLWAQRFGDVLRIDVSIAAAAPAQAAATQAAAPAASPADDAADTLSSPLDPRFTLDTFVAGASNALAHAAAQRVAEGNGAAFNPLFIHGPVGLGKTHLLQATAAALQAAGKRAVYMTAEAFMYRFVRALRGKEMVAFKDAFRAADVLLIDDLQFICGKEATQEEFFHTFNALTGEGRQVVLAANCAPAALEGIDARLRSRLSGGLVAEVTPADEALRLAILERKCALLGRAVPQDVLAFLARNVTASVRELEGALNRLIAHAELSGKEVTLENATLLLRDVLLAAGHRRVSVDDIQRKVAEHYNLKPADMLSPRRARAVARPRQVAMYLAKTMTGHSLPEIGRKFGGRDHTTVIHGVRRIEELLLADKAVQADVETLRKSISG